MRPSKNNTRHSVRGVIEARRLQLAPLSPSKLLQQGQPKRALTDDDDLFGEAVTARPRYLVRNQLRGQDVRRDAVGQVPRGQRFRPGDARCLSSAAYLSRRPVSKPVQPPLARLARVLKPHQEPRHLVLEVR